VRRSGLRMAPIAPWAHCHPQDQKETTMTSDDIEREREAFKKIRDAFPHLSEDEVKELIEQAFRVAHDENLMRELDELADISGT
jgi:hypothetical protein